LGGGGGGGNGGNRSVGIPSVVRGREGNEKKRETMSILHDSSIKMREEGGMMVLLIGSLETGGGNRASYVV